MGGDWEGGDLFEEIASGIFHRLAFFFGGMGKMRRIGESIDGAATVGRAPNGKSAPSGGDWRPSTGRNALCGRRADSSAFEYTRRAAELQAFRGNFFAESGTENAPKRKRTANGAPDGRARAAVETRRRNVAPGAAVRILTFFNVLRSDWTPGVLRRLDASRNRAIMKG